MTRRNLYIGNSGYGEILFENVDADGFANATTIYAAYNENSSARVDVKGTASGRSASQEILLGYKGRAEVNITDGGELKSGANAASSYEGQLEIGSYGTAVMNIRDGGWVYASGDTYLGMHGRGVVNISGEKSAFEVAGNLDIGANGYGELNIGQGAAVTYQSSRSGVSLFLGRFSTEHGVINLATNSKLISRKYVYIGGNGQGEVNVAGGELDFQGSDLYLGMEAGGMGRIIAEDAQLLLSDFSIGEEGDAEVRLKGVRLKIYRLWVGVAASSKATLLLDASQVECSWGMEIGFRGNGRMDVVNGSAITMWDTLYIGSTFGKADGVVAVDNSEIRIEDNGLSVGISGTGALNILNGGKVYAADNIHIT